MGKLILAINPGSTSTKISVYEDTTEVFTKTLRHSNEELAPYKNVIDQLDFRKETIKAALAENNIVSGNYSTVTDGTDAIFDYTYQKMNTPAESLATGNFDPIVTYSGTIYYKDGAYSSSNGDEWVPGTGTAYNLKLNFDNNLFKSAKNSEDGLSFEIQMNAEALKAFLGTDLNVSGLATVTVSHNGTNLTFVTITCSTENGTLTIRNSYTYNRQDNLFPEVEEE